MTKRQILIPLLFFLSACSTSKKMTLGICDDYFTSVKVHAINGTRHCRNIMIANGVIIRTEENNASQLTHISVIKCPDSYKKYGDIGTNGVIVVGTKQTFEFVTPAQVDIENPALYRDKKKLYFLNGFLINSDSLKISRNAIKRVEVLKSKSYFDTETTDSTCLINIWTLTKKEVRKSLRGCRRSFD